MDPAQRKRIEDQTSNYIIPTFVEIVHFPEENLEESSKEIFLVLRKVVLDPKKNVFLSWAFVWLTSEIKNNDFSVTMKISLKGIPKPGIAANMGNFCVPDLSWTMEPITARAFAEWMVSKNQKLPFPFSLPLAHINKYYVDSDDMFTVSFAISKE